MKHLSELILILLFFGSWMGGVVLATGVFFKSIAIFIPFYAWYLFVERLMKVMGLV